MTIKILNPPPLTWTWAQPHYLILRMKYMKQMSPWSVFGRPGSGVVDAQHLAGCVWVQFTAAVAGFEVMWCGCSASRGRLRPARRMMDGFFFSSYHRGHIERPASLRACLLVISSGLSGLSRQNKPLIPETVSWEGNSLWRLRVVEPDNQTELPFPVFLKYFLLKYCT